MNFSEKVLLDTDTLSYYIKQYPKVVSIAQNYLRQYNFFTFSIITRFEILRGLKANGAATGIKTFDVLCSRNEIIGLSDKIIVRASDIYADLYKRGLLILDADILIAATALEKLLSRRYE
ncbi:MAG: PIN domain-containing protein [Pyrinomonadaceae bacterium]